MLQVTLIDPKTGTQITPDCIPYMDSAGNSWVVAMSGGTGPFAVTGIPVTDDFELLDEDRQSMQCAACSLVELYRSIETMVGATSLIATEHWYRELNP